MTQEVTSPLARWWVRRLHNGLNRWTQRRLSGADGRFGWSAASYASSLNGSAAGARFVRYIDGLSYEGHCREDYERIVAGKPLDDADPRHWALANRITFRIVVGSVVILGALGGMGYAAFRAWT